MIARLATRLLLESDPKVLGKFVFNFGYRGMRSVQRFAARAKRGDYFPAFLFLSVTNGCNLRCQGCWVSATNPPQELDPNAIDRIITQAKELGTTTFGILGGEPLMYDGLLETLGQHPDCYFILFTNGTLITDETARTMRRLGNISPLISIEGREAVSDQRRGGSGVYTRTMRGLQTCRKHGLITGVATSICRSNIDELATEAFVNELVFLGVHYLWYYIYRPVGPNPAPQLALDSDQVIALRRFMVDIRSRVPLLVVDAYWDHEGRALCPAAVGIGYHISPAGEVEPCPPIQFACDNVLNGRRLHDVFRDSSFLASFREVVRSTTRGCILLERPDLLEQAVRRAGARDSSGRGTALAELEAMGSCPSHHQPGEEIPERSWPYRFAKKHWFFGLGAYG